MQRQQHREEENAQTNNTELREIREEAESILKELGLSSYAARSFLAISENSPMAAASLCQRTGIADSKIYYALKELEEKSFVIKTGGTPQLYSAQKPKEVAETLNRAIELEHERNKGKVARLEKLLKPLSKTTSDKSDNLEIAYITRGFDNVVRRASKLLASTEKQVVGYIWDDTLYSALEGELKDLFLREVKSKLALNPMLAKQRGRVSLPIFGANKTLLCQCNLLVIDNKKMITITRTRAETYYAIITEDPGMISLGVSYYDNPSCCAA